jgi:hypothetical protein
MHRLRLIVAIFFALCLLGAQQAAYAHVLGHIGCTTETASAPDGNKAPHDPCLACTAFAGLAAAPPAFIAPMALAHGAPIPSTDLPTSYLPTRPAPPYASRAPPAVL